MSEFQFVGDVSELSVEQKNLIGNVLKERGFKNVKVEVLPVGNAGDNYVANVQRISVEKNGESFKMIAKVAPKNDMKRTLGNIRLLFQNENVMYTEVLPKFTELEKAANIPEKERLRYAICYGTYLEEPNEIILLQDLEVPGFKMLDRFSSLADDNVRMVLKNFANLHSLSYVLKYKEPETFEKFTKGLANFWLILVDVPEITGWFTQIDADVQTLLDDDKYKTAVKNAAGQMIPRAAKLAKIDADSKFSVIQQGDAWTNNIMFKIENDITVECCMIDYQASKLSSPVADIQYMIFNCTDHATRTNNYYDWIDYYHSQLDKSLGNYGLKANFVYPRDQFDADLRRFAKFSLGQAVMAATIMVRETADATKLKDAMNNVDGKKSTQEIADQVKISASDPETINKCKTKIEGLVLEERGFKNVKIDIQPVGQIGDNFVANVKRITVEKDGETFKMIAKVAPRSHMQRVIGNSRLSFLNEDIMYTQVLAKFSELEKAADIPEKERFRYAACYETYMEEPNEIILLEDLQVSGYKILDKSKSLTDENVRLVLKNFAVLHSLSYVLRYKEPETFEKFCKSLINFWSVMANAPEIINWFTQIDADVQMLLDDDKYKKAVKNAVTKMLNQIVKLSALDINSKHSVIQQGDPWTNNIMFRLENDRSVDCCMIDYQISKQSNPVADLHYMIFNCTDYATRAKHFHDWIDYYYSQLDKSLANFGLKANYVYPRDQIDADLRRFAKVSLGQGVMLSTMLVRDNTQAADVKKAMSSVDGNSSAEDITNATGQMQLSTTNSETIEKFKVKLHGLVDSFIEFGYL
ncbi:uncharacterized protein LOC113237959 [Hyposmocoma kahamanoa]|uniref:uncharacterized protein LOC113237959 n=1 Tax=Hyposmocoma kahamanoa TaxID=1477025 RepID=UPI000E6D6823|nr:uncharacterized protein LOC113237959 [Hyposmocoma kahamanoa]